MTDDYRAGIRSTASFAGHPIHAILVAFPISFLMGALATDLLYWWTAEVFWAQGSYWLLIAGLVMGVLSVLTGLIDFVTIKRSRDYLAGWLHLVVNVTALGVALLNLLLRLQDSATVIIPVGLILSFATTGLLSAGGWFGGELIYRLKIGVFGDEPESGVEPIVQTAQASD